VISLHTTHFEHATGYYAHVWGRTVISRIYPAGTDSNYGYAESVYHWASTEIRRVTPA
jgi:hypothetical protein